MAQITVFGYVTEDPVPKQSQNSNAYMSFSLRENIGKGRWQTYQVWAWNQTVQRIIGLNVKSGSFIWLTGKLELVDCTVNHGKERTKVLKIYCSDFGYLPQRKSSKADAKQLSSIANTEVLPIPEEIDGDRMPLPE